MQHKLLSPYLKEQETRMTLPKGILHFLLLNSPKSMWWLTLEPLTLPTKIRLSAHSHRQKVQLSTNKQKKLNFKTSLLSLPQSRIPSLRTPKQSLIRIGQRTRSGMRATCSTRMIIASTTGILTPWESGIKSMNKSTTKASITQVAPMLQPSNLGNQLSPRDGMQWLQLTCQTIPSLVIGNRPQL